MRKLLFPILLGFLIAVPGAQAASTKLTIRGAGFGHGIGMSQWGAYAQSRSGLTAEKIIQLYYRDSKIDTLAE